MTYTGEQNYNRGTKQDLISKIVVSFGTEPIANRVINELYAIQESYKVKEPWQFPDPELEPQKPVEVSKPSSYKTITRRTITTKKNTGTSTSKSSKTKTTTTKKVGKYVQ